MKVTFNIECTPEEARTFFGLPDVAPMQERLMDDLEKRLSENIRSLDPEVMVKTWLPMTVQGWGEVQKLFWQQMGMPMTGASGSKGKSAESSKSEAASQGGSRKKA